MTINREPDAARAAWAALEPLIDRARAHVEAMTPEQREEMFRRQREGYVRAEMSWPTSKFRYENGVKVYESYEDYVNG